MGMTAQRRWRHRAAAEAQAPAAKPLPAFLPQTEHQLALQELTKSYELRLGQLQAELDARRGTYTIEVDAEPVQDALKQAAAALDAADERAQRLLDIVVELRVLLVEHAPHLALPAPPPELLPEEHRRPTLEEFVQRGYTAELYDVRMAAWENELLGVTPAEPPPDFRARIVELEEALGVARQELLEIRANAGEPGAKAELAGESHAGSPANKADDAPPQADEADATKPSGKGGKPKPR